MSGERIMTNNKKKEIMIAVLLVTCVMLGVAVMLLVENSVGRPVYYDGDMKNICVRINEICPSNKSIIADDKGNFSDYIELYNYGETFTLSGFGLANDTGNSVAYTFGDIEFHAGQYLVVFLGGAEIPFRLSNAGGEYVALVAWDGTVIDSVTTVACAGDEVMLYSDTGYFVSDSPSPGYPNTEEGAAGFKTGVLDDAPLLVINEILLNNGSALPDFEGDFGDIIEIKNISDKPISTAGFYISDTLENRSKCALPSRELQPGEFILVYASGKSVTSESGEFHANFKLSDGEDVVLSGNGKYTTVKSARCGVNESQARVINSDGSFEYVLSAPSLGFDNDEAGAEEFMDSRVDENAALVINEVLLSRDEVAYGGKLRDVIEICNRSSAEVSSKGWFISDSDDDPYKFALPETTLAPGGILVLYAERGTEANETGFSLSSGESVYLTAPDFKRGEAVSCASAGRGLSRQLRDNAYVSDDISIGFANDSDGIARYEKQVRPETVEISEAVSLNTKYLPGPYGTYCDFLELHNRQSQSITLDGWFISDDPEEPRKASLDGVTVPADGYVVIILSSDGLNTPSGYKAVRFSLASSGETLVLSQGDEVIDCMALPSLGANTAFGRAEGYDGFSVLSSPTPKSPNGSRVTEAAIAPTAATPQGVYDNVSAVSVTLSGEGTIYYTLDCSEPTAASAVYGAPITISRTTVIRCCSIAANKRMSDVTSLTYIINEGDTLDAVSLVTTPENLWDYYTGIYETGPNASSEFPYVGANYWQTWEKEATVSLYTADGGFSAPCGIRIFGAYSRALPKKSISCFFRAEYGASSLNYKLFDNDDLNVYEAFVLRNTGQDWNKSNMRDAMISSLVASYTDVDVQNCRPVALYLNGEFWGVYFIREKINENFIAGHYNVSPDKVEICRASGTNSEAYTALIKYVSGNDLSVQSNYDYVASQVDIDNYIDYIISEICMANTDNGNIRFYRVEGGKWRWIMFDVDQSFREADNKTVAAHLNPAGTGSMDRFPTRLINGLLKNPDFKKKFLSRFAWQLKTIWNAETVIAHIDVFADEIGADMMRDCAKWERDYSVWTGAVETLKSFASRRVQSLVSQVQSYFSLSDSEMKELGFTI